MKNKKTAIICGICAIVIIVGVVAYSIISNHVVKVFNGSRVCNPEQYLLDFNYMNREDCDNMKLKAGDDLHATWNIKKGTVNITVVRKEDGKEIFKGNKVDTADFILPIEEDGTYVVTIDGRKAKGVAKFVVE